MKRKTKAESRTQEWADFAAILRGVDLRSSKPQSKRIERLLELLSSLGGPLGKQKRMETFTELRCALSRYQWTRTVEPFGKGLVVITRPAIVKLSEDDAWECRTADDLLGFASLPDGASRIRRCEIERCRAWFYASGRKDQRWCSGRCRQYHYDNSEERKEKRRLSAKTAMRSFRKREKRKDERIKKAVGFVDRKKDRKLPHPARDLLSDGPFSSRKREALESKESKRSGSKSALQPKRRK